MYMYNRFTVLYSRNDNTTLYINNTPINFFLIFKKLKKF